MKIPYYSLILLLLPTFRTHAQTLEEAKNLYKQKNFAAAKAVFEKELEAKPNDPSLNLWYGISLYETGEDANLSEPHLKIAEQKSLPDAFLYLGDIYAAKYQITQATTEYDKYARVKRADKEAIALINGRKEKLEKLTQFIRRTEDVQIIDSVVVDKDSFLKAYKLSPSCGKLTTFNELFDTKEKVDATAYLNEKGTKIVYSQMAQDGTFKLYSMEKLLDQFGNEKLLAPDNFGLKGDENYPFMQTDGVTLYFASKDENSMGGYDLFVTRFNLDKNSYLVPERLNMPFNSPYNDYMLAIDEEKGVGWFASDRFQPKDKVCIYTFIPNDQVKTLDIESIDSLALRSRISSIKDSWRKGQKYDNLIESARKTIVVQTEKKPDFTFVINDNAVYHSLKDFQSKEALNSFVELSQIEKKLSDTQKELDEKRQSYSQGDKDQKRQMTEELLKLENETETLFAKQKELTKQVRMIENKQLEK